MKVNGADLGDNLLGEEECKKVQKVVSKYGVQVVCSEEEEAKEEADLVLPAGDGCANVKKVASKLGYQVVCDEEA